MMVSFALLMLHGMALVYLFYRVWSKSFKLVDVYIVSWWVAVFVFFTAEYYQTSALFSDERLLFVLLGFCIFLFSVVIGQYASILGHFSIREFLEWTGFENIPLWIVLGLLFSFVAFDAFVFVRHGFVFSSTDMAQTLPYWILSLLSFVKGLLYSLTGYTIIRWRTISPMIRRIVLCGLLVLFFTHIVAQGRREIFYFLCFCMIFMYFWHVTSFTWRSLRVAATIFVMLLAMPALFDYYQSIRVGIRVSTNDVQSPISLSGTSTLWERFRPRDEYLSTTASIGRRKSPIWYMHLIFESIEDSDDPELMYFSIFENDLYMLTPQVFLSEQKRGQNVDDMISLAFGLPLIDYPQTLPSQFYACFSWFGFPLAALFLLLALWTLQWMMRYGGVMTKFYAFGAVFALLFMTEGQSSLMVLNILRSCLICVVLDGLFFLGKLVFLAHRME
jgi:hypothetical protein